MRNNIFRSPKTVFFRNTITHQPQGKTMKKFVLALTVIAVMAAHAAEFKFPGLKCTDTALLQQQLLLAPGTGYKIIISYLLVFAESPPATFQDAAAVIADVTADIITENVKHTQIYHIKRYTSSIDKWLDDLVIYCLANPTSYDVYVAQRGKLAGKPWAREMLTDRLRNHNLSLSAIPVAINLLIEYNIAGEVTNEEMKDILQKLNLRYTNQLAVNKEQWAPVVARIRTLLELY
jgi:hypothetical protein